MTAQRAGSTLRAAPAATGAWLATCAAMTRKELLIGLRYPAEMLASFAQVFLITAVFTLATLTFTRGAPGAESGDGAALQAIVAYGFIPFIFLTRTLWDIGFNIRREQLQGTLESVFLSPASQLASLISRTLVTLVWVSLLAALAIALMVGLMGTLPFANPLLGLAILLMTLSMTFGVGFAFAALTLRVKESAGTLANAGQFAFMVFCAPFYPFSALPGWGRAIARLIPLSYGVDALRSVLMGLPAGHPELAPLPVELAILAVGALVMPVLGLWLYHHAEADARRNGTLGLY